MAVTIDDVYKKVVDLYNSVEGLPSKLLIRAGQIVVYSGLSDISEKLGIIRAGEFRAGNRYDPNYGFSGMRMAYPAMRYNNEDWNLVGVENDILQFGVRASDGKLIAGGGAVVLDSSGINAIGGTIAGWQIQPTRLMNNNISLYSTGSLQTNDFASGIFGKGWRIASDGSVEFNNAFIRGELRTTVLTYQEIQAVSGTLAIFKSAGVLLNPATIVTGTFTIDIKDPPIGHVAVFAVNDRLRIKTGAYDVWFNVTAVSDQTTFYRYTCSYVSGSSGITFEAGTGVINYGQSGQGLIEISTIGLFAPFIKMGKHSGTPHTGISEYLRIGNLNGSYGYTITKYGIGIGEYVSNKTNLTLDEDGAIRIRNFTTEFFRADSTGLRVGEIGTGKANVFVGTDGSLSIRLNTTNILRFTSTESLIENILKISGTSSAIAIGNPPPTSSSVGTGIWIDRTAIYELRSSARQLVIGNLNGSYSITTDTWGMGIGEFGQGKNYLVYTPDNGLLIRGKVIAEGGTTTVFRETFDDYTNIEQFIARLHTVYLSGNLYLVTDSSAIAGGKILRVGDNDGYDYSYFVIGSPVPYNPQKLYRMFVRVRRTAGSGTFYAGVAGMNYDKTQWVNCYGHNSLFDQHYFCAEYIHPNSAWTEYVGYLSGTQTGGIIEMRPDPSNPLPLHQNAKYILPIIHANFLNPTGIIEIDEIRIDEVSDTITADKIASGTLQVNTKLTIGQAANNKGRLELEANADGTGTLKGIYRNSSGVDSIEAYFGSDGKFYAGGGKVKLNSQGINIVSASYSDPVSAIKFEFGSQIMAYIEYLSGSDEMNIYCNGLGDSKKITINAGYSIVVNSGTINSYGGIVFPGSGGEGGGHFQFVPNQYFRITIGPPTDYYETFKLTTDGFLWAKEGLSTDKELRLSNTSFITAGVSNAIRLYSDPQNNLVYRRSNGTVTDAAGHVGWLLPLAFGRLIALWTFGEGYSDGSIQSAIDLSPNKAHLFTTNPVWTSKMIEPSGGFRGFYGLNGTNAYHSRACDRGLNANNYILFGGWFRLDSVTRNHGFARAGSTLVGWSLVYHKPPAGNGYVELAVDDGSTLVAAVQRELTTAGWHFIGMRYFRNSPTYFGVTLCLDGIYYDTSLPTINPMRTPTGTFEIGRAGAAGNYYLQGAVATAFVAGCGIGYELYDYYYNTKVYFGL